MEVAGIKFAPVNIPMERRLQTLAAAAWFITMAFGGFICFFFTAYLLLYTRLFWLVLAYLLWVYAIDNSIGERGGRPSKWIQSWTWWRYFRDYFPLRLERLPWVELDPNKNYLFCVFPHGVLSAGAFNAFATQYGGFSNYFPKHDRRVVTLTQHFNVPFFRELALGLGGVSATADSIDNLLKTPGGGMVTVIMPGGVAESYYARPGWYKFVLNSRKGFVRLALKNGTPLVPVLSFGETDLFDQVQGPKLKTFQEKVRKFIGMAPVVLNGRGFFQYTFGLVPRRKFVATVVGTPIELPKIEEPTNEQINEYHEQFKHAVVKMFEEQKYNYLEEPEKQQIVIL